MNGTGMPRPDRLFSGVNCARRDGTIAICHVTIALATNEAIATGTEHAAIKPIFARRRARAVSFGPRALCGWNSRSRKPQLCRAPAQIPERTLRKT
jgi:hypothetical protein